MVPISRVIISKDTGLLGADSLRPLLQFMWKQTAQEWGPSSKRQIWLLRSSSLAQVAARQLYYKLHEEDEVGG